MWDLGSYAITPGRLFFNEMPEEVIGRVLTRHQQTNVDTSFSILARYPNGKSLVGHFGFDTEYRNYLNVFGMEISIFIDRVFSMPPHLETEIQVRHHNQEKKHRVPSADTFSLFLQKVLNAILNQKWESFRDDLLKDAHALHQLRLSTGEE